jgi:hypothetical protein
VNSLYCFLGIEGLTFLKRGYLPFLSPAQLSDPWLQSNTVYQAQTKPKISAESFHQHLRQQYQELPENLRAMISFDYFEQQSLSKRELIEQSLVIKDQHAAITEFDCEAIADWRLLSLYSAWQPTTLWQQLGAAGQGMVLEFELSKSDFKAESYNQHAQHFSQVQSVQHWQPLDDLYYLFQRPSYDHRAGADEKGTNDNCEWRLARKLKAADRQIEVRGAARAMYRLPTKAVKRVILGYACSLEYCQQVKLYLSQDIHYRHSECVQAQLDPQTMRLQLVTVI